MRRHLLILAPGLMLAACGATETNTTAGTAANDAVANGTLGADADAANDSSAAATARATLQDGTGAERGEATATQTPDGVRINVAAVGLEPGELGFHVHNAGRCDGPAFESAGPHWNPTDRQHGSENPQGQHLGDLPNLTIGADGRGSVEATIAGATLTGGTNAMLDADGSSIMIHAGPDDYRTDPSGDSGGRIACGVFSAG